MANIQAPTSKGFPMGPYRLERVLNYGPCWVYKDSELGAYARGP